MSQKIDLKVEYTNRLVQENEALKAQVEQLRQAGAKLREPWDLSNILGAETRRLVLAWDDAFSKTPAQCLAEIKAQAGRDGFIAGLEYPDKVRFEGATRNPVFAADEYANQLRRQGELK